MTYNNYPQRKDKENVNLPNGGVMQNAYQRLVADVSEGALGETPAEFNELVQAYKQQEAAPSAELSPNDKLMQDLKMADEINADSSVVSDAINNVKDGSLSSLKQLENSLKQLNRGGNQPLSLDEGTIGKLYDIVAPALRRKRG